MDDTPAINDGADTSLRKTVSLLNKIETNTSSFGGGGGGGLTDAQLRASPVPVDIGGTGSITITSGTVTVSNEVEVTNDEGNPLPVSGTVTANVLGVDNVGNPTAIPVGKAQEGNKAFNGIPIAWNDDDAPDTRIAGTSYPLPIQGAVTANTGLSQPLTDTQLRATAVPVSGPLTDTQLRSTAVPVSGSVSVSNLPATQPVSGTVGISGTVPVSGTFWQTTQPVSGPLTDTQLRASSVPVTLANTGANATAIKVDGSAVTQPVSGTFWPTTQPISGTVTANAGTGTFAVSGPLTDAQLRAAAVPVSGPLTDTQLRATAVPVSGTFWQTTQPVSDAGGSLTIDGLVGLDESIPSTPFYTFTTSTTFPSSWITPAVDVSSYSEIVLFITGQSGASGQIGFQGEYVAGSGNYFNLSYSRIQVDHTVTFYPNGSAGSGTGYSLTNLGFAKIFTSGFKTVRLFAYSSVSGTWTVSLYGRKTSPIEPGHPLFGFDAQRLNNLVFSNNRLLVEASQSGTYAVNNSIASNLKAQVQILDSSGGQLTYAATGTAGTPASDVVTVQGISGGVALSVKPRAGTPTILSSTTGGGTEEILSANSSRQYLLVQNLSDTDMNINFGAAASASTLFIPKNGGGFVFESGFVPTTTVELYCASSGKAYYVLSS